MGQRLPSIETATARPLLHRLEKGLWPVAEHAALEVNQKQHRPSSEPKADSLVLSGLKVQLVPL